MNVERMAVFPAPAGINRKSVICITHLYCVPRASGDKPDKLHLTVESIKCSPRQRG